MNKGKVKWYNETKGFGFIISDEGKEIFVHRTGLYSAFAGLDTDEEVTFELKEGPKGLVAFNVKTLN